MRIVLSHIAIIICLVSQGQNTWQVTIGVGGFVPSDFTIDLGDTVHFIWLDGIHTTTSDSTSGANSWADTLNPLVDPMYTETKVVITNPGTHRFYCSYHGAPGGQGESGTIRAWPVGMKETRTMQQVTVFPNPFTDRITLLHLPKGAAQLQVLNMIGQVVHCSSHSSTKSVTLDLGKLPAAVYWVQFLDGSSVLQTTKINKTR